MLNKTAHPFLNVAPDRIGAEDIRSAFEAFKPIIPRLVRVITPDESEAVFLVLKLAQEAAIGRAHALAAVSGVVRDYIGLDGVFSPPRREIARRLELSPDAVDAALDGLIADGYLVELPRGFLRRQRRFRLMMPDTPPPF